MLKVKYKGYLATQNKDNTVYIYKDDILVGAVAISKRLGIKELRTLINKHIKDGEGIPWLELE